MDGENSQRPSGPSSGGRAPAILVGMAVVGLMAFFGVKGNPFGGGSPLGVGDSLDMPIQVPALVSLTDWNHAAHWELVSVGDRLPMDCVRVDDGNVFFGRTPVTDDAGWDYQVAEITTNDRSVVTQIHTGDTPSMRTQGEVLIARHCHWRPATPGDVVPRGAVTFMTNPGDGPCVVARFGSRACKLNMDGDGTASDFRYISGSGTSAVSRGDILIVT